MNVGTYWVDDGRLAQQHRKMNCNQLVDKALFQAQSAIGSSIYHHHVTNIILHDKQSHIQYSSLVPFHVDQEAFYSNQVHLENNGMFLQEQDYMVSLVLCPIV